MSNQTLKVHPKVIGRELVAQFGIEAVTKMFNAYRKSFRERPVSPQTIKRYNGGGGWYDENTPQLYRDFLLTRLM